MESPTGVVISSAEDLYNDELTQAEMEGITDEEAIQGTEAELSLLASHIVKTFETNKEARKRSGVEDEIFNSLRDYNGVYNPDDLSKIAAEGGSSIYMNLTATKSRAAMSWIRDILQSANEDAFSLAPTPIPSLPEELDKKLEEAFRVQFLAKTEEVQQGAGAAPSPQVAQETVLTLNRDRRDIKDAVLEEINLEAREQMALMERKVKDDLKEGGWDAALSNFIEDFCIFPNAFMKGPVVTKRDRLRWEGGKPVVESAYTFMNKRVAPVDVYPSPTATSIQEGCFIEHLRLTAEELAQLKGAIGYSTEAIDKLLEENTDGVSWIETGIEDQRAEEERRGNKTYADEGIFHALHFWGSAKASDVEEWGLELEGSDPNKFVEIEAILVGSEVIKCKLNNDPLKRRPYYSASYQNIPGSFWGRSLPSLMRDIQRMCNACARALANNMGLAAGPQIELYIDRLADAGDIEDIKPLKIWQVTNDPTGASGRAINFFQVPSIANELMGVYDKFEQKADDATGIPRYSYGNEKVGGAAQALADYEKVSTPHGPVYISNLVIGDIINNTYGSTSKVTGVYPQGERDIFKLSFSNGESVDCDMNHRWSVRTHIDRSFKTLTTEEILDKGLFRRTNTDSKNPNGFRPKWMVPKVDRVELEYKDIKIDPYTMGAILGDGDHRARLTSMDQEVFDNIPYPLGKKDIKDKSKAWSQTILGIREDLRGYIGKSVCYNKFIPKDYLWNSSTVREEVLKGLMDTDGCISKTGDCFYYTVSKQLAKDFKWLVKSLGGSVKSIQKRVDKRPNRAIGYRIAFNTPFCPVKLTRKVDRFNKKELQHVYITGVEYVGKSQATCITVDAEDSLFLVDNFIPTHNTASGLSMLLESATKSIKDAIRHIDSGLIIPRVEYQFYWNLIKTAISYTGDVNVIAHGSDTLTLRGAQQAKRQEFLQITANQSDQDLMGPEGRSELIRELAKDLNLRTEIVPSRLEIRRKVAEAKAAQAQAAQQGQTKDQSSLMATKLQVEAQQRMHEQTQQVKLKELEQRAQTDQERANLEREKLAVSKESTDSRAMLDSQKMNLDSQTKRDIARTGASVSILQSQNKVQQKQG